jgi:hypothetical protein
MLISVSRHDAGKHGRPPFMGQPLVYRIRVRGLFSPQASAWFEGLSVVETVDGATVLRGPLADQAALHGVLARIRDLGLELVSVTLEAEQDTEASPEV